MDVKIDIIQQPKINIKTLTSLRFLFAFWVVACHYLNRDQFQNIYVSNFLERGWQAVPFFFTLSGFVLYIAYKNILVKNKISILQFLIVRLGRLYFAYFVALIVIYFIFITNGKDYSDLLIVNIFMLQSLTPSQLRLGLANWSISVEMVLYALFLPLSNLINHLKAHQVLIYTIVTSLIIFILSYKLREYLVYSKNILNVNHMINFFYYFPLFNIPLFFIGILLGKLYTVQTFKINKNLNQVLFVITLVATIYFSSLTSNTLSVLNQYLLLPVLIVLIYSAANLEGSLEKLFSLAPFVYLGEISYGIYIYQDAVKATFSYIKLSKYFGEIGLPIMQALNINDFIVYTLILIVISIISFKFETLIYKQVKNLIYKI